ncbi:MAG: BON domain-containing protein, partial [Pseudomonadota bacterium]
IEVRKSDLTRVVREVRALLNDVEGISVKIVNRKVIIDGKVLLPRDLNRIYGVIKQFDGQVDSLVEVNPIAQKKIAEIIEKDINNPDIEVHAVNGKFILKGIANSESEKAKAEIIAKTYVPAPVINEAEAKGVIKKRKEQVVINLLSIRASAPRQPDKIIQLVVHYVEMSKNYLRSSSFRWAPSLEDNTSVGFTRDTRQNNDGIVAEISGVIQNLLPKLNSAKAHGFARILESTSVTTKNGQPGVVQSGTRIPFLVQQGNLGGTTTEFADVGVKSEITPNIINPRSDIIELKMKFEVSTLVGNTERGPSTANNTVTTTVDVRSGQSAAVGGLITNTSGTEYNPENNPEALFNLNASKSFRRNKSQFVIFVTPIIKSSASTGSEKIKRKFRLRE